MSSEYAQDYAGSDPDQVVVLTDLLDVKQRALLDIAREVEAHRDLASRADVRLNVALLEVECARITRRLERLKRGQEKMPP